MNKNIKITDNNISVLVVTTSFPTRQNPVSGIFIKRLIDNVPSEVEVSVLTPCSTEKNSFLPDGGYQLKCFCYGPWKWQRLAHQPGGIPAVLDKANYMKLLLPVFLLSMFIACIREMSKHNVVHANWSVNGFICALANLVIRRPLVLTLRGTDISKSKSSRIYRMILRFAMQRSRVITVVSEAMYRSLISEYPGIKNKIIFVPNGVDSQLLEIPIKDIGNRKHVVQLLVIANLIKLKNVPVIIKAIAKLGKQLELKLTVVGDGPEKKALESLSRELAVADRVVFKGLLEPDRISECLEQADCLVLTSLSEGKPNVVLEAFAAGRPVVASNIDGVSEMIGENENGLLFEARDEQMLAAKLLELFNNRGLYKKFSENGRKYILNNKLSWAETGKRYADIYRELVETA